MPMLHDPFPPGYVCPKTGRVAVLVADLAESDLNGDAQAYWFNHEAEQRGLDPWHTVEGVNPDEDTLSLPGGPIFDLVFTKGPSEKVGRLMTVFVSKEDAERLRRDLIRVP